MIENGEIECFGGPGELARGEAVGLAGPRVAAGVIMRQHHARAAEPRGIDDDFPDGHVNGFGLTLIAFDVEATGGVVDMGNPQPLALGVIRMEAGRKEAASGLMAVEKRWRFGTLEPHESRLWKVVQYA